MHRRNADASTAGAATLTHRLHTAGDGPLSPDWAEHDKGIHMRDRGSRPKVSIGPSCLNPEPSGKCISRQAFAKRFTGQGKAGERSKCDDIKYALVWQLIQSIILGSDLVIDSTTVLSFSQKDMEAAWSYAKSSATRSIWSSAAIRCSW